MFRLPHQLVGLGGALVATLLISGCATAHDHGQDDGPPAPPPVAMRGEATYFDGKLRAEVSVTRGRAGEFAAFGGHRHGGRRGGHRHGGGGGDMGGERPDFEPNDDEAGMGGMRMRAAMMPAVTLHLHLENKSTDSLDVQIRDFKSDLGDFAVRPERVQLAAGQSVDVDPMISQLGVTSDLIPVTVALRAGGKTETQDVLVKNLFTPDSKTQ
jgi:hypothetical protein